MDLTLDQIVALAPDSGSAAAGKKLAAANHWQDLGHSDEALWGQCKGSALYQVRVELANLGYKCSCPSRKFPCKHVLGLLMLAADKRAAIEACDPPEWVSDWLSKRTAKAAPKEPKEAPADPVAQAKRAEKRDTRVREGVERLNLWLADLVRNGLAGVEAPPPRFWQEPAARLVDAQAPGLAARVNRMADIPGSSRDWPRRLVMEMGRLRLLLHAYDRIDELDPALRADVKQLLGWTVGQEELDREGERVSDTWTVFGQWVEEEERLRVQRSWLAGRDSGRIALVLQFAPGAGNFPEPVVPGSRQRAELLFYPGAYPQRAKFGVRESEPVEASGALPAATDIAAFLSGAADALARQPWLDRFGCVLSRVVPVKSGDTWYVRDESGYGLPLSHGDPMRMLALSGGHPFDLGGEWNGESLRALGMLVRDRFYVI